MAKKKFDWVLLRLKESLGIHEDQDVAALLGMTKAALSARKSRDSFPEDKLLALVAKRPDLNIDVAYVLTGDPARVHAVMSNLRAATDIADSMGGSREEKAARQGALMESMLREKQVLTGDEALLLESYRSSSLEVRKHALRVLLSGDTPPPSSQSAVVTGDKNSVNQSQGVSSGKPSRKTKRSD